MPYNSRTRKKVYRPITNHDREAFKAMVEAKREEVFPKQLSFGSLPLALDDCNRKASAGVRPSA